MTQSKSQTFQIKSKSPSLFKEAESILVGGVNSPVRAFKSVNATPIFISHGQGAYLTSEEGKVYLDYVLAFGPHILGHANPAITKALQTAASKGTAFGAPTTAETALAKCIQKFYPKLEKIRLVNSGTEATMSAVRLARGITKRSKIIKFNGCYHGHEDCLLVKSGSGTLTLGQPDSLGVPKTIAEHTISIPFNNTEAVNDVFKTYGNDIAAVIVEPAPGNMGLIPPKAKFLGYLRQTCNTYNSLLIFDEVMIGFRAGKGGIQSDTNVLPDITCLGKVIGGGLPCGAFGGSADVMNYIAPEGPVYQAGTLSGNSLVTAAGIAMLDTLYQDSVQRKLQENMKYFVESLSEIIKQFNAPIQLQHYGTLFSFFFTESPVSNLADAKACNIEQFKSFHKHMLDSGIFLAPSAFESGFISTEHNQETTKKTANALKTFLQNDFKKC